MDVLDYVDSLISGTNSLTELTFQIEKCKKITYIQPRFGLDGLCLKIGVDYPEPTLIERSILGDVKLGIVDGKPVSLLIVSDVDEIGLGIEKKECGSVNRIEVAVIRGVHGVAVTDLVEFNDSGRVSQEESLSQSDIVLLGAEDWFDLICQEQSNVPSDEYRASGKFYIKAQVMSKESDAGIVSYSDVEIEKAN